MQEISKQQVLGDGAPFGLYLNSPREVKSEAELRWLVGMPIPEAATVAVPLKKGAFNFAKVARYLYTGPYDKSAEAYAKIMQYLEANGYRPAGPVMEQYWNDPLTVKPEQLMTEIIIPVEKK
jgi:DNA gyrase inhibitor GyrI